MDFNVCSYNLGASSKDYNQNLEHRNIKINQDFDLHHRNAQKITTEFLDGKADVYCLQEVISEERPLIENLKNKNFEIIHVKGDRFHTAIAINKDEFERIENHSIQVKLGEKEKDVAIAKAVHKTTQRSVVFISAHVPGFSFETEDYAQEHYGKGTEYEKGISAKMGTFCCLEISKKLSQIGNGAIQIIGADMNALPEEKKYHKEDDNQTIKEKHERFKVLQNRGFELLKTGSATNVTTKSEVYKEREIDFFFTKKSTSIWQSIKSIFWTNKEVITSINTKHSITWEYSSSDHLPIFLKVTETNKRSKLHQLWTTFTSRIGSIWKKNEG